jgi:hypothetical protein
VLPFEFLEASFAAPTRPSVTGGPSGVADACVAARARWFLPYAHGFDGLASASKDAIVDEVASALAARRAATSVVALEPGGRVFRLGSAPNERPDDDERLCGVPASSCYARPFCRSTSS